MWEEILKIMSVIGVSSLKHTFFGVPMASLYGYSILEVFLYTSIGGTLGLFVFLYFTKLVSFVVRHFLQKKKKRRIFTPFNRFVVYVRQNFGLYGIAFITPPLLSIPIGTIIASSMYSNKRKVFLFLFASILFWSFLGALVTKPLSKVAAQLLMN